MKLSQALIEGIATQNDGNIRLVKNLKELEIDILIGGWLDCSNNQLTSLVINHPIGDSLYCFNNQLTSLIINQPIGGSLYCSNNQLNDLPKYTRLEDGMEGENWVYLDNKLTIFTRKRKHHEFTIYTTPFSGSDIAYAVTNGTHSAHAKTIKRAIIDIRFKESDRNIDDYKGLSLSDKLSYEDAIIMYRAITGACSGGTENFLAQHDFSERKKYSVQEILDLTQGQYGHDTIRAFFEDK
jgi:hypothetical protein